MSKCCLRLRMTFVSFLNVLVFVWDSLLFSYMCACGHLANFCYSVRVHTSISWNVYRMRIKVTVLNSKFLNWQCRPTLQTWKKENRGGSANQQLTCWILPVESYLMNLTCSILTVFHLFCKMMEQWAKMNRTAEKTWISDWKNAEELQRQITTVSVWPLY